MTAPEGIVDENVVAWLGDHVDEVDPPLDYTHVEGGRSNLTYIVSDQSGRRWVLRRPPLHGVLPSAHDMGREHAIISALWDSAVPVPRTIGYEPDDGVIGAEFYVMDFVEGAVLRSPSDASEALEAEQRRRAGESVVDVLVDLHAVDPDEVGLGDLAKKEDYIARQLHRWHGQLRKGREQGARELPVLDEVHDRLAADIPEQQGASIVHGDYRLDNVILDAEGNVQAVLDWELCTLGDPLADVGILSVYWSDPGDPTIPLISAPTTADGFPRRDEVVGRYGELSGRDLSELDYYVAFAYWKLAIILEGVYSRFASGAYGQGGDDSWRAFGELVLELGTRSEEATARVGR